jgi:hypothetical protein
MAKRTTMYVAFAVLIVVAIFTTFVSRNIEKFGTPTGVKWCTTPTSCISRSYPTSTAESVDINVKTLTVYPGYKATFGKGNSKNCVINQNAKTYYAQPAPYNINEPNGGCIFSGEVKSATSA